MFMNKRKFAVAIAAAGVVAASGSAFTASNTIAGDNVAGYGTSTVTGATTQSQEHTLSADGTTINSTLITFTTDLNAEHQVKAGFGTTLFACTVTQGVDPAKDTATCTYTTPYTTSTATDFRVTVS